MYNYSFFNTVSLQEELEKYEKILPEDVTCLVSTGSSGCAIASALILRSTKPLKHLCVHKKNQESHRGESSGIIPGSSDIIAFVDDFICTGKSKNRCIKYCKKINVDIKYLIFTKGDSVKCRERKLKTVNKGGLR